MNILIIGGVAAGTKVAAKLKRENRNDNITIITKDKAISYACCGMPYYIGGLINNIDKLLINSPEKFMKLTGVNVITEVEGKEIDPNDKVVKCTNLKTSETISYKYDKLIIATGASPIIPNIENINLNGVFTLRNLDDTSAIANYITENKVKKVVIIGAGFIGIEVADNLYNKNIDVTLIDACPQILSNSYDLDYAEYIKKHLTSKGIKVFTNTRIIKFNGKDHVTSIESKNNKFDADMVIISTGIKANTDFVKNQIELYSGKIVVNDKFETNIKDIYAIGDCTIVTNRITGQKQYSPMGSSANIEGRKLAKIINGSNSVFKGVLGTSVMKLPGLNIGRTGLTECDAKALGYNYESVVAVTDDKAHYYPNSSFFIIKLIACLDTKKILGVQVVGGGNVNKIIDIAVTGINLNAKLEDFEDADYAYAPPFSTAIHPFVTTVNILLNKINKNMDSITPLEYLNGEAKDYIVIDTNNTPEIEGAKFIDLSNLDEGIKEISKDDKLLIVCNRGRKAYLLQNILKYYGFKNTKVLEGATTFNDVIVPKQCDKVTPEEIKRVKGLGFLQDKTSANCFNARVITRNGKISSTESEVIAKAASLYGNGKIAMTTRMTIEIQKIPYQNINSLIKYLNDNGLETGGTGSKVRPVVSCKGTTCQYGLIDTFDLSEKIHDRFYKGYHNVLLPHKFKIAVGGCPNNCVKPDLNDIGVIGQKLPIANLDLCKGCKNCQIVNMCPVKACKLEDNKIVINKDICNNCGRCDTKCPFKFFDNFLVGYKIYIGGRWGKKVGRGIPLDKIFATEKEVLDTIEKAILFFREKGITGERFADTIERIGFEEVQRELLSNDLLERKDVNLSSPLHTKGGATC